MLRSRFADPLLTHPESAVRPAIFVGYVPTMSMLTGIISYRPSTTDRLKAKHDLIQL
jgi:hypothetical protein